MSPFYTAMVNLSSVPAYRAPLGPPEPTAAARRAAGYPPVYNDSRPYLQRDFSVASITLEGPATPPRLPEVGRRRRSLQQLAAAVLPPGSQPSTPSPVSAAVSGAAGAADSGCSGGAACFAAPGGSTGMDAPPAGTMGLAVGKRHVVQAAGGVMAVYNLSPAGSRSSAVRSVSFKDFFAGVAPSCEGVHDAAAVYDKHADRFVVAASCGSFGRLLLGVSATPSAAGTWFQFGLVADGVDTKLECRAPKEQALVDYPQLGYNKDALFITYYSYCPSRPSVSGATLLALPKYKAYQGAPSMYYGVYTAAEVAAAAGLPAAAAVRQLQPVLPQSEGDVQDGVAYFVSDHLPRGGEPRSSFTLVALANTGALWGYAGGLNEVPSPTMVAAVVPWGREAPITPEAVLKQPLGGADLSAGGTSPAGFWSGGAALSRGKLMLTARSDVTEAGSTYSPRPGVIWAEVAPSLAWNPTSGSVNGTEFSVLGPECPAAVASGMESKFDWSKDFSLTWGSEFARNWSWSLSNWRAAAAVRPRVSRTATRAAAVVLSRASRLSEAAKSSPAANFQQMAFPLQAAGGPKKGGPNGGGGYHGRDGACGCESSCGYGEMNTYNYVYYFDDYCDAGANQWGPESGMDMWGTTYNGAYCNGESSFGLVGNHQFDQCGKWCAIRCPRDRGGLDSLVNPNYGYLGATNVYPGFFYASLGAGEDGAAPAAPASPPAGAGLGGADPSEPFKPTAPMQAAACATAAALSAAVVRSGAVDPGAPLGLAFPSVAVAPNGAAVVTFTFSGPGKLPGSDLDAFPGVGAAFIDAKATGAVPMDVLERTDDPIAPVAAAAGGAATWGEQSASDVHPVTGAVYVAARRGGLTRTGRSFVGTWLGFVPMAAAVSA